MYRIGLLVLIGLVSLTRTIVAEPLGRQSPIGFASLKLSICAARSSSSSSTAYCLPQTVKSAVTVIKEPAYVQTRCPAVNGILCRPEDGTYCCYFNEIDAWGCCLDVNHCCGRACCSK